MEDQINLQEITDINELNKLYVTCNESFLKSQEDTQRQAQNLQNIRLRMAKVQDDAAVEAAASDGESTSADK